MTHHFFQVKKVHSSGGYGSQGYGYDWKISEAKKNLLRTHTTAVSARMLYKLSQVIHEPVARERSERGYRPERKIYRGGKMEFFILPQIEIAELIFPLPLQGGGAGEATAPS